MAPRRFLSAGQVFSARELMQAAGLYTSDDIVGCGADELEQRLRALQPRDPSLIPLILSVYAGGNLTELRTLLPPRRYVARVVRALTPRQRDVLRLRACEGLSREAVAGQLGIDVKTVIQHETTAWRTLRQIANALNGSDPVSLRGEAHRDLEEFGTLLTLTAHEPRLA